MNTADERWDRAIFGNFEIAFPDGGETFPFSEATSVRTAVAIAWVSRFKERTKTFCEPHRRFKIIELSDHQVQVEFV